MEFRILGPLEVQGTRGLMRLPAPKPTSFLLALLLQPNRGVSHEHLIEAVWGEQLPNTATAALHTYVSRLRSVLAEAEPGTQERIVTLPNGYLLRVEPGELDLERFREHVERARVAAAAGKLSEAAEVIAAGLSLWRGTASNGISGALEQQLSALDEEYIAAVELRIELKLAMGEAAELIAQLNSLIAVHPLRERLREHLMLALYRSGRQYDALAVYQDVYRLLGDELGIRPGPGMRKLHQRILAGDPTLWTPSPTRAKTSPVPRELPLDVPAFTGRDACLEELDGLLGSSRAVVTMAIDGIAGIGKTALALHWAHRAADRLPDGQLYVNLRGYAQSPPMLPTEALARFLRALGVPQEQIPFDQDEQAAMYRSLTAERRMLVVLDNAATAEQVRPLLPGSATCLVLITSRADLSGLVALEGAHRLTLEVLTAEEAHTLLERTLGDTRVGAEADAVPELARLCGYLPLAIRIAAAHLAGHPGQPIADYLEQLKSGDRLTQLGIHDDPQAAVRASFDLSYQTLSPAESRLFRLLGLVPGPDFTPPAAAALMEGSPETAARLLDRLAAAHLIENHVPGRYQFHDLIRLYAGERARSEDHHHDDALRRLFDWYLHTADGAAGQLYREIASMVDDPTDVRPLRFTDHGQTLAWLDAERANLVAVVRHASEHGPHDVAWRLAHALRGYFFFRIGPDWLETASAGLKAASDDPVGQAAMLHSHSHAYYCQGDSEQALVYGAQALRVSGQTDDRRTEPEIHKWSGLACWLLGRLDEALDYLTQSLKQFQAAGNRFGEANVHIGLTAVYDEMGRWDDALEHSRYALDLSKQIGTKYGEAISLQCIGMVHSHVGRDAEAHDFYTTALSMFQQLGSQYSEAACWYLIAVHHRNTGNFPRAIADGERALEMARKTGDTRSEANSLNVLGTTATLQGQFEQAIDYHAAASDVARKISFRRAEVQALTGLALAHNGLGHHDLAVTSGQAALAGAREGGFLPCEGYALTALSEIHRRAGQYPHAVSNAQRALRLHRFIQLRIGEARALRALGQALYDGVGLSEAEPYWREAVAIFSDLGSPEAEQVMAKLPRRS